MADDPVASATVWPVAVLRPAGVSANTSPFTRSGGRSLTGIERGIRTDRGFWRIAYRGVVLGSVATRRQWNSMRIAAGGRAGLLAVPVWSFDVVPLGPGVNLNGRTITTHDDGTGFDDGSTYEQPTVIVEMASAAAIGDTSVRLRIVWGLNELDGVRWSWRHALYECGLPTRIDGAEWTVPVFPAVRAAIPADVRLEFDMPTCLVHLATDDAMDARFDVTRVDKPSVDFVEAVDVWADLAA